MIGVARGHTLCLLQSKFEVGGVAGGLVETQMGLGQRDPRGAEKRIVPDRLGEKVNGRIERFTIGRLSELTSASQKSGQCRGDVGASGEDASRDFAFMVNTEHLGDPAHRFLLKRDEVAELVFDFDRCQDATARGVDCVQGQAQAVAGTLNSPLDSEGDVEFLVGQLAGRGVGFSHHVSWNHPQCIERSSSIRLIPIVTVSVEPIGDLLKLRIVTDGGESENQYVLLIRERETPQPSWTAATVASRSATATASPAPIRRLFARRDSVSASTGEVRSVVEVACNAKATSRADSKRSPVVQTPPDHGLQGAGM